MMLADNIRQPTSRIPKRKAQNNPVNFTGTSAHCLRLQAGRSAAFTPLHHPKAAELRFLYGMSLTEAA
jgi:hypothetical protein